MKKFSKGFIGLCSLAIAGGCVQPKTKDFILPAPVLTTVSDPDLTLIKKEVPKYYSLPFDRADFYFSTNKTQQTHAILSRNVCPDTIGIFHQAPIGETMKQKQWEKYLMSDKICPLTGKTHFNNWQKFYQ